MKSLRSISKSTRHFGPIFATACIFGLAGIVGAKASEPRLNQIQVIGTHNSYHLAPHEELMKLLRLTSRRQADSIDYSHRSLAEQFGMLGIRQIELDLFHDPEGGLFAKPALRTTVMNLGRDAGPDPNADGVLNVPGHKVLHVQDVDYRSTVPTFESALRQILAWSAANPAHVPIMVLVELKDNAVTGLATIPRKFDAAALNEVDGTIDKVFARSGLFVPDDLRGDLETLPEAISKRGWPELKSVRGKVMFALDNEGTMRDRYIANRPNLSGRRMFVTPPSEGHASAAFFKINDPVRDFEKIRRLAKAGYIVRTRADADTRQARSGDTTQRNKALASGAQFVSTDYPEPRREWSDYQVKFENGVIARPNPVSGTDLADKELDGVVKIQVEDR